MNKEYKNNTEPKVGDLVMFASEAETTIDPQVYYVTGVGGGRMGNKLMVVPNDNRNTFSREYYYHCFVKIEGSADRFSWGLTTKQ